MLIFACQNKISFRSLHFFVVVVFLLWINQMNTALDRSRQLNLDIQAWEDTHTENTVISSVTGRCNHRLPSRVIGHCNHRWPKRNMNRIWGNEQRTFDERKLTK